MEHLNGEMMIRKLPVTVSQGLAKLFEGDDSILSLMMGFIATDLENPNSTLRFTSSDIDLIRNHSQILMKSPVLILIDEWSTMGKVQPKLRHLLALLIKCQLFRAADYLAKLIGLPEPTRPNQGPAAFVDIDLPNEAGNIVNVMDYPFSNSDVNLDNRNNNRSLNSPNINFDTEISRTNNATVSTIRQSPQMLSPVANDISNPSIDAQSSQTYLPALSILQNSNHISTTINSSQSALHSENIPAISGLMVNRDFRSQTDEPPTVLESFETETSKTNSSMYIPQMSMIFGGEPSTQSFTRTSLSDSSSDSEE